MKIEYIDNAIFEVLRLALVENNYLPDVTIYTDIDSFETAKEALRQAQTDKQLIDICGVGTAYSHGKKVTCKIIIDRKREYDGYIGSTATNYYEKYIDTENRNKFKKMLMPANSKNIEYEIRIVSNNIKKERVMKELIDNAIGSYSNITCVDETGTQTNDTFVIKRTDLIKVANIDNITEWVFDYLVRDVYIEEPKLVTDKIAELTDINSNFITDTQTVNLKLL